MSTAKHQSKKAVVVVLAGILASVLAGGFFYANAEEGYHGVKSYGQLSVRDGKVYSEKAKKTVQLRGISSHGLSWYPEFTTREALRSVKQWGANLFRAAMYTDQEGGYLYEPEAAKKRLYTAVDNALAEDMYAIADWHTLKDKNPLDHVEEAKRFFREVSAHYGNNPGVIYEICNEPNGDTSWEDVKRYAEQVIPEIRANAPQALILCGTQDRSANLDGPLGDPIDDPNLMYDLHFYADASKEKHFDAVYEEKLLRAKLPIFVSEWGISYGKLDDTHIKSPQDSRLSFQEAKEFAAFLRKNQISWTYWSLSNKAEAHSIVLPSSSKKSNWESRDLTPSGILVRRLLSEKE